MLLADDLGVLRGDGLFESLLVLDGQAQALDEHVARMRRSALVMDLAVPSPHDWRRIIEAAVAAWPKGREMAVRLVATRGTERDGPTWYALADPVGSSVIARRRDGVSVIGLQGGLDPALADRAPWLLMGIKSLSYAVNMAARRWAHTQHAEDAILLGPGDLVLEATTSAVVIVQGRTILSPPVSLGILPSITVARLFAGGNTRGWEVGYERLTMEDLHSADGVWLLSSIVQAARVHTLDGKELTDRHLDDDIHELLTSPPTNR